jgi:ABC-type uncharacterized transport system substrate-binding protein
MALGLGLASLVATRADAHPHVWVVARSEIVFGADGRLSGFRHTWLFDPAYSAFAVMGLDNDHDGKPDPDKLAELAKTNVESLDEFGYFTAVKVNGAKVAFGSPQEYDLGFSDGRLTLHFLLPLTRPAKVKVAALQIDDPSFFVAFNLAESADAVTMTGAPKGCALSVKRPDKPAAEGVQILADDIANALNGRSTGSTSVGADYIGHILVACP